MKHVNRSFGKYILSLLSASYNPYWLALGAVFLKHENQEK
jgi:hypothetical protein